MPPPPPAEVPISVQTLNGATTPVSDDHDDRFGVPTLEELGVYVHTRTLYALTHIHFSTNTSI